MSISFTLDHVFAFVEDEQTARAALDQAGLTPSFGRRHAGQGTANLCACFDNAYVELLWVEDQAELISASVARTRLVERSRWRETGACPFGIGLRGRFPFPAWEYQPPYLSDGSSIAVALASEDPRQPFLFRAPGSGQPAEGADQRQHGLLEITSLRLELPVSPNPAIRMMADSPFLTLAPAVAPSLSLTISRVDCGLPRVLILPAFQWRD